MHVQPHLKTLEIHPSETTLKNYLICKNCWIPDGVSISNAARLGRCGLVKILLQDYRWDSSNIDQKPICLACANGHSDVVKVLLESPKVDPSTDNQYPFLTACSSGYPEVVEILLKDPR